MSLSDPKGMPPPVVALVFGLLSALLLPLGALIGIGLSPVNPYIVACWIAFGAGCLMFAVTVELYGDQLMHLQMSDYHATEEIIICLASAFVGAILYILLNRWVEGMEEETPETPHEGETRVITKGIEHAEHDAESLALGMLAGIIADGIPESVLIGLLASEGHLSMMFVVSLFIANFPESFSSASLMIENNVFPWYQIV